MTSRQWLHTICTKKTYSSIFPQEEICTMTRILNSEQLWVYNLMMAAILEYCLKSTYVEFRGQCLLEQLQGAPMLSSLCPITAKTLSLQESEIKALNTSYSTLWLCGNSFIDDTLTWWWQKVPSWRILPPHWNQHWRFLTYLLLKLTQADGTLPFLDVLVIPQAHGSIATAVYRKLHSYHSDSTSMMGQPFWNIWQCIVYSVLCSIGPKKFAPLDNIWRIIKSISNKPYQPAKTPDGHWTE